MRMWKHPGKYIKLPVNSLIVCSDPQPRIHKCEGCSQLYECKKCTEAMYSQVEGVSIYSKKHAPSRNGYSSIEWLCDKCIAST